MINYIEYENYLIPFSSIAYIHKSEHKKYTPNYSNIIAQYSILKICLNNKHSVDITDSKLIEEIPNNYVTWLESQSKQQPQF